MQLKLYFFYFVSILLGSCVGEKNDLPTKKIVPILKSTMDSLRVNKLQDSVVRNSSSNKKDIVPSVSKFSKHQRKEPSLDLNSVWDNNCYNNGGLSIAEKNLIYPFNKAKKIAVISYNSENKYSVLDKKELDTSQVIERINLDTSQINEFTEVLFNFNYRKNVNISTAMLGCYHPRHTILFYDQNNEVFESIAICLECRYVTSSYGDESFGDFCSDKYDLFKSFMLKIGIKYYNE
jgi:hypothetical protein